MRTSDQIHRPGTYPEKARHHWFGAGALLHEQGLEAARDRRLVEVDRENLQRGSGRFGGSTF